MLIEYLEDGSPDCPLIRIYGGSMQQFEALLRMTRQLGNNERNQIVLNAEPGFTALNGCVLKMIAGVADLGVQRFAMEPGFLWTLTPAKWTVVSGLIEPFVEPSNDYGFQWLCGKEAKYGLDRSKTSVLISSYEGGEW